ncbi:MAG: hypothetical protein ACYDHM_15630 [Acidiferrobacterales bacterium]
MATVSEHQRKELQTFLDIIAPWKAAYGDARFAFIGARKDGVIKVLQGQLLLGNTPPALPTQFIETTSMAAGYYALADAGHNFEDVLERLVSGILETPHGPVEFALNERDEISLFLDRQPQAFGGTQRRITNLRLSGIHRRQELLDAAIATVELREAERPYSDINELSQELMQAPYADSHLANIEIRAFNVAEVDLSKRIIGGRAELGIFLSRLLEPAQCSLGYRVLVKGAAAVRNRLAGDAFTWELKEMRGLVPLQYGSTNVQVPPGAVLQCFVSYAGQFQHDGWIVDPETFPNALRMAHSAFDPDLQNLRNYLSEEKSSRGRDARDFETGIANLLFLLGFSVDPLFGKPLEDGPDLIATTREGHIALVECTTSGVIDKEGKLGKLVDRAEKLRTDLKNAAHDHLRVLPVIVTPRPRDAVAEKEDAKGLGIVVLTREDLEAAIEKTIVPQDPDALFSQAWESVQPKSGLFGTGFSNS